MEINQIHKENNTFEGIKELYDNNNFILITEGIKQIIPNHIKTEFHIDDNRNHDIFEEIKQIEENTQINNDANEILKRRNSSPFMMLFARQSEIYNSLTKEISNMEIRKAIICQKDNKATGNDNIPTEIFKQNIYIRIQPIEILIQAVTNSEMPAEWKQGAITLIFKSGCAELIKNYRHINLLNSIYKIWATVITNRLKPIMNILTNETQRGCKIKNQQ